MKLTSPLLRDIATQMTQGNPLLGLAILNEYLSPSSPLHRAFVAKLHSRLLTDWEAPQELIRRLAQGEKRAQLPIPLQSKLGKKTTLLDRRALPSPRTPKRRSLRRLRRERALPHMRHATTAKAERNIWASYRPMPKRFTRASAFLALREESTTAHRFWSAR